MRELERAPAASGWPFPIDEVLPPALVSGRPECPIGHHRARQSPDGPKFCRTNIDRSLTWQIPWKDTPLLDSGLLGPVRLIEISE